MAISATQNWVVCERSGRWSAALRVAFARLPNARPVPRLYELRTLAELSTHLDEQRRDLALVEVAPDNLVEVLKLLVRRPWPSGQFVALMDKTGHQRHAATSTAGERDVESIADLLWEAGVVEVVESPLQLRGLFALNTRLAVVRDPIFGFVAERQSFADWAWSTLPWQDR